MIKKNNEEETPNLEPRGPKTDTQVNKKQLDIYLNKILENENDELHSKLKNIIIKLETYNSDTNGEKDKHILYLLDILKFSEIVNYLQYLYNEKYSNENTIVLHGAEIYRLYQSIK